MKEDEKLAAFQGMILGIVIGVIFWVTCAFIVFHDKIGL